MDGRTTYSRLLTLLAKHGKEIMHAEEIKQIIRQNLSSHPKTVDINFRIMIESKLIEEIEPFKFKLLAKFTDG